MTSLVPPPWTPPPPPPPPPPPQSVDKEKANSTPIPIPPSPPGQSGTGHVSGGNSDIIIVPPTGYKGNTISDLVMKKSQASLMKQGIPTDLTGTPNNISIQQRAELNNYARYVTSNIDYKRQQLNLIDRNNYAATQKSTDPLEAAMVSQQRGAEAGQSTGVGMWEDAFNKPVYGVGKSIAEVKALQQLAKGRTITITPAPRVYDDLNIAEQEKARAGLLSRPGQTNVMPEPIIKDYITKVQPGTTLPSIIPLLGKQITPTFSKDLSGYGNLISPVLKESATAIKEMGLTFSGAKAGKPTGDFLFTTKDIYFSGEYKTDAEKIAAQEAAFGQLISSPEFQAPVIAATLPFTAPLVQATVFGGGVLSSAYNFFSKPSPTTGTELLVMGSLPFAGKAIKGVSNKLYEMQLNQDLAGKIVVRGSTELQGINRDVGTVVKGKPVEGFIAAQQETGGATGIEGMSKAKLLFGAEQQVDTTAKAPEYFKLIGSETSRTVSNVKAPDNAVTTPGGKEVVVTKPIDLIVPAEKITSLLGNEKQVSTSVFSNFWSVTKKLPSIMYGAVIERVYGSSKATAPYTKETIGMARLEPVYASEETGLIIKQQSKGQTDNLIRDIITKPKVTGESKPGAFLITGVKVAPPSQLTYGFSGIIPAIVKEQTLKERTAENVKEYFKGFKVETGQGGLSFTAQSSPLFRKGIRKGIIEKTGKPLAFENTVLGNLRMQPTETANYNKQKAMENKQEAREQLKTEIRAGEVTPIIGATAANKYFRQLQTKGQIQKPFFQMEGIEEDKPLTKREQSEAQLFQTRVDIKDGIIKPTIGARKANQLFRKIYRDKKPVLVDQGEIIESKIAFIKNKYIASQIDLNKHIWKKREAFRAAKAKEEPVSLVMAWENPSIPPKKPMKPFAYLKTPIKKSNKPFSLKPGEKEIKTESGQVLIMKTELVKPESVAKAKAKIKVRAKKYQATGFNIPPKSTYAGSGFNYDIGQASATGISIEGAKAARSQGINAQRIWIAPRTKQITPPATLIYPKVESIPMIVLIPKIKQESKQGLVQQQFVSQGQDLSQRQEQAQEQKLIQKQATKQLSDLVPKQDVFVDTRIKIEPIIIPEQTPDITQITRTREDTPPPPPPPPRIKPPEEIIPKPPKRNNNELFGITKKKKTTFKKKQGYAIFVKRKGSYTRLGLPTTKESALDIGTRFIKGGLGSTFKLEATEEAPIEVTTGGEYARYASTLRSYQIRKGQRINTPNTFIEKRGTRLSTPFERAAIKSAKMLGKTSRGKSKWF